MANNFYGASRSLRDDEKPLSVKDQLKCKLLIRCVQEEDYGCVGIRLEFKTEFKPFYIDLTIRKLNVKMTSYSAIKRRVHGFSAVQGFVWCYSIGMAHCREGRQWPLAYVHSRTGLWLVT